jgi:hypothetical protein
MPSIKGAASDEMLHHYVRELAGAPAGHRAIWLRLSRLDPSYRREKHVQIACRVVEELIRHFTGRVFVRPNGDVVLISQEMKDKIIRHTAELLRNVFGSDSAQHGTADQLCAIYDLESDYPRFVSALLAAMQPEKATPRSAARRPEPPRPVRRAGRRGAARQKPSKRFMVLAACILVVAALEGILAYRSSQTPWVFDSPDAQKRHQLRNSWTGEYSFGK